jgi:CubicO group peptidase (beta-lactamase class C family)
MVVHRGHVVAEGWWAPYSAERPHLLYSLTKSFTSVAVGLAISDGLLALDDRVVDVLPDHVPDDISEQARRLTVHHLLSMTVGNREDSLSEAWRLEPDDLVKGFLRTPFPDAAGSRHVYDNSTTYVLARMVERVTGRGLPEFLDERLFAPMGIDHAEWDRVASGAAFGFHGLHLTTEAIAAFGELLLRGGRWHDRQLVPRAWVDLATTRHVDTLPLPNWLRNPDFESGYGYQFWISRHGYHGHGSYGQYCVVVPEHDLVIAVTGAVVPTDALPGLFWECLFPGLDDPGTTEDDETLADRLRQLTLAPVPGSPGPAHPVEAKADSSAPNSPLPDGTSVIVTPVDDTEAMATRAHGTPAAATQAHGTPAAATQVVGTAVAPTPIGGTEAAATPVHGTPVVATPVDGTAVVSAPADATPAVSAPADATPAVSAPADATPVVSATGDGGVVGGRGGGGWVVRLGEGVEVAVGFGEWWESSPLGRPIVAAGAWEGDRFVADIYVVTTPHRVRLVVEGGTASAAWNVVPLTGPSLALHVTAPLMTRPDVS